MKTELPKCKVCGGIGCDTLGTKCAECSGSGIGITFPMTTAKETCPKCWAFRTNTIQRAEVYTCGTVYFDGVLQKQSDRCRIAELRLAASTLEEVNR